MDIDQGNWAERVLEQVGDALIVIDRTGTIRVWNAKCTELFGWPREEAVGQPVSLMIPERLRPAHDAGFGAAMVSGHLASDGRARRTKALTASGEPTYVEMTFAVLTDESGAAIGAVAMARPAPPRTP